MLKKKVGLPDQGQWCVVACRYSQEPGINFSENYSTVVYNNTFHILLLLVLNFGYSAKILYDETFSLCGDLEEEIHMERPQRMADVKNDDSVVLSKNISMALFKQLVNTIK